MLPWIELDSASVAGETDRLRLLQRGREFAIKIGTADLMSSRLSGSEKALATLTCERLRDRSAARLLIGGLGMGFTLGAALAAVGPQARIVVSELVPIVATWARGPLAPIFDGSLDDPRVELRLQDVVDTIRAQPGAYDAILLDVDNGPDALTRRSNDRLYNRAGLARIRQALRPGGILAVWSAAPDATFAARLSACGFAVDEASVPAHGTKGLRHTLWFAKRGA